MNNKKNKWYLSPVMFRGYRMFRDLPLDEEGNLWAEDRPLTLMEGIKYWWLGKISIIRWLTDRSEEK